MNTPAPVYILPLRNENKYKYHSHLKYNLVYILPLRNENTGGSPHFPQVALYVYILPLRNENNKQQDLLPRLLRLGLYPTFKEWKQEDKRYISQGNKFISYL